MRKIIIMIILLFGIKMNMMSQIEYFFLDDESIYNENDRWKGLLLPQRHGIEYNYYADNVPIESGCLVLMGMGFVYMKFKKRYSE